MIQNLFERTSMHLANEASAAAGDALQKLEAAVAGFPGLLDAGGHLVAAARRR